MRLAETALQDMLAKDTAAHAEREAAIARHVREATQGSSLRRRLGAAVIAFGVRLAGDHAALRDAQRQLATRPF